MMWWPGFGFHWAWMVIVWIAMIALIVWAVVRIAPTSGPGDSAARRALDERFARGELDRDEYRRRHRQLGR